MIENHSFEEKDLEQSSAIKMKRYILLLLFSVFLCAESFAQINKITNPVYLGMMLVDQPNVEKMVDICEYYGLTEEPAKDGFSVYRYSDGTVFQFKVEDGEYYSPVVKVSSKESAKTIDKVMTETGFMKEGQGYVKGSKFEHRRTKCKVSGGSRKVLVFSKEYNSI